MYPGSAERVPAYRNDGPPTGATLVGRMDSLASSIEQNTNNISGAVNRLYALQERLFGAVPSKPSAGQSGTVPSPDGHLHRLGELVQSQQVPIGVLHEIIEQLETL